MQFFGITLDTRGEKSETLKHVIGSLNISLEEKDLYILSLEILNDQDFIVFFNTIMSQIDIHKNNIREYSIEPLTSQII